MTTTRIALVLGALMCGIVHVTASQSPPPLVPTGGRGLTEVHGIRVGHHTLTERPTGCTVILVDGVGASGGVSQRGGAPGTRETDLLNPLNMVDRVNAIVLSGGSAFGLDVAQGVMQYLEERGVGYKTGAGVVPIVPAAILYDLGTGGNRRSARPPNAVARRQLPRQRDLWLKATWAPAPAPR